MIEGVRDERGEEKRKGGLENEGEGGRGVTHRTKPRALSKVGNMERRAKWTGLGVREMARREGERLWARKRSVLFFQRFVLELQRLLESYLAEGSGGSRPR